MENNWKEKGLTGYASIDKPWLKYYTADALNAEFVPMSMYQLMKLKNIGHENETAIVYGELKITYGDLLNMINKVAASIESLGINQGDIVMMSMINIPEAEYLFYALNKLGIIVNSIDPRSGVDAIKSDLKTSNAKFFFCVDALVPMVLQAQSESCLTKIIAVSPTESFGISKMDLYSTYDNVISWNQFISLADEYDQSINEVYIANAPAVIVHTGGSTGIPKGVILSNENCNSLIYQMMYGYSEFKRNSIFLNIMPPFVALGLNNAMHLSACLGLISVMIPSLNPADFPNLIIKYKPNILMAGPLHFNLMLNSIELQKEDLSFIEICCAGGDKLPAGLQARFQTFLKDHNSKANMWIGYGATETSSGTTCMRNNCFKLESVGIPYLHNTLEVFDLETGEKIKGYGNIGELRVSAPTIMLGYLGNVDENAISIDNDGIKWYHTGDLAHFDQDGLVYIDGRIKRIILRRAYKIYPAQIEEIILRDANVKECAVVGVPDPDDLHIPVANIVLIEDNIEKRQHIVNSVNNLIEKEINEFSKLCGFNFLTKLPVTPMGKIDYRALENIDINSI